MRTRADDTSSRTQGLCPLTIGLFAATILWPVGAVGGTSSRLLYSRGEGAETCPDETALRGMVAGRLGYDPFVAYAKTTIVVAIERDRRKLRARVYLDEAGFSRGAREFVSENGRCEELAAAVALAVSIALDPMHAQRAEVAQIAGTPSTAEAGAEASRSDEPAHTSAEPEPSTVAPTVPQLHPENAPLPVAADARPRGGQRVGVDLGGGAFLSIGSLPNPSGGPFVSARVRILSHLSIAAESRVEMPETSDAPAVAGRIRSWAWGAGLSPCWHFGAFGLCATGAVTEVHAQGEGVTLPRGQATLVTALGGRVMAEWTLGRRIVVYAQGDVAAPLARIRMVLDDVEIWTLPPVTGSLALGMRIEIL
jgi:hypothetical protein